MLVFILLYPERCDIENCFKISKFLNLFGDNFHGDINDGNSVNIAKP